MLKAIVPNIMVESVGETVKFYEEKLKFSIIMSVPKDDGLVWAMIGKDEAVLMIQQKDNLMAEYPSLQTEELKPSLGLYFKTDTLEKDFNDLKYTVKVAAALHKTTYDSEEFAIFDNNGNILIFGE
ncbi:hypothetical protein AGMMS50284_2750 [Clostridia bacterium]|nr:hypothetical protein AGMMS50284_2750 [Clostridia bacterium]